MTERETEQKIKKMAKSGEFKEKLLNDPEFMAKIQEILKKEGIETDDATITRMISETQDYISGKKEVSDYILESIAGGANGTEVAGAVTRSVIEVGLDAAFGAGIGAGIGNITGDTAEGAKIGAVSGVVAGLARRTLIRKRTTEDI